MLIHPPGAQVMTLDSEREAFEKWIRTTRGWETCKRRGKPFSLVQTMNGDYRDYRINDRWYAWKARANLTIDGSVS